MHFSPEGGVIDAGGRLDAGALRRMAEQAALASTLNLGDGYTLSTTAGQVLAQPPAAAAAGGGTAVVAEWAFDATGVNVPSGGTPTIYSWPGTTYIDGQNQVPGQVLSVSGGNLVFAGLGTSFLSVFVQVYWSGTYAADASKFLACYANFPLGNGFALGHAIFGSASAGYSLAGVIGAAWQDVGDFLGAGQTTILPTAVSSAGPGLYAPAGPGTYAAGFQLQLFQNTGATVHAYPWVAATRIG
jgi:hypothetical protein